MNRLRNKLFQMTWSFLKGFTPRKTADEYDLENFADRMLSQLRLARKFGGPDFVILGDSNGENLADSASMTRFGTLGVSCNIAIGGSRAEQWSHFLRSDEKGSQVKTLLDESRPLVVFNIGGNNVLQFHMDEARQALEELHTLYPRSYNCLIPPIHASLMGEAGYEPDRVNRDVDRVNEWIREIWKERTIDTYTPFVNQFTGEAYWIVLGDAVHFSPLADTKVRIPLITAAVKLHGK